MKALIVEDELVVAADLRETLEELGYEVVAVAKDADEAERVLETQPVDLVFLDVQLRSERDGIDLADAIRRRFDVPFLFVTAHADAATVRRARATRPLGFLVKPFSRESVFAAVEMALGNAPTADSENKALGELETGMPEHRLREVKSFVHRNFSSDLSLDRMAEIAGMSKFHFCRSFRRATGITPYQYLLEVRIGRAKRSLQSTPKTLGEVAEEVGFNSQSQFNRAFRKMTGVTPGQFRRGDSTAGQ